MKTLSRVLVVLLAWCVCPARAQVDGEVLGVSPGSGSAMAVLGDMLCLGSGQTLFLEDIRDLPSPATLGSVRLDGEITTIALYDSFACVGLQPDGLCMVDMRNPRDPRVVHCESSGSDLVLVRNGYLYCLENRWALRSYSLEDPADPQLTGFFRCEAEWMAINDRHLFLGIYNEGIQILDLENPANPALAGALEVAGLFRPQWFAVTDSLMITRSLMDSLRVFDIQDPLQVEPLAVLAPYYIQGSMATFGNCVLFNTSPHGVVLVDLSDGTNPVVIGPFPVSGFWNLASRGSLLYFMEYGDTLSCYDLSDAGNPVLQGESVRYCTGRSFSTLGRLTLTAASSGVQLEDFSEPGQPRWLGRITVPGSPRWITVIDSVAFVGTLGSGLQAIDLGNPDNPLLFPLDSSGNVVWMGADDRRLNLLYDTGVLRTLDVTDPRAPTEIRTLATGLAPWYAMAIEGPIACVSDDTGFRILDLEADGGPQELFSLDSQDVFSYLVLEEGYLYTVGMFSGVRMYDIRDPENPVQLGSVAGIYDGSGLRCEAGRLFACDYDGNLMVLDVRDPSNPLVLGHSHVGWNPYDIQARAGVVFVPTYSGGIWTLRFPGLFPPEPAELSIATRGPDVVLTWEQPEASEWNVYRLVSPFEVPGPSNIAATVSVPVWTDVQALGRGVAFYRVTAVVE